MKGKTINKKAMPCNKPRRTPSHPKKSHVVKACESGKEKIIRFGEQGAKTAGKPKKGESERMKAKRKSFKARHAKNIKKGKMSGSYWSNREKWTILGPLLIGLWGGINAGDYRQPDSETGWQIYRSMQVR